MTSRDGYRERPDFVSSWLALLRRRGRWAGAVFVGITGLAVAVVFLSRPVYRAEARLRLGEPPPMSGVSPNAGIVSFLRLGGDPFANDLELLASRSLAESVVRDVSLSARVLAPRGFHRDSVLTALEVQDSTITATFEVTWTDPGTVSVRRASPTDSVIGDFPAGTPVDMDGVRATFRTREEWGPEQVTIRTVPFGEAVRPIPGRLVLTRTRREANVLLVSYSDSDPGVATAAIESAVGNFLIMRSALLQRESDETVDSLRTVARATEEELRAAEQAIEDLQRATGIVAPDVQSEALIGRYEETLALLRTASAELDALDAQLVRVAGADDRVEAWTTLVAHPRFLENLTVGEMLGRLTALEGQRTDLASRRRAQSREVQSLEAQIDQLDGALRTLATEFRGALAEQVQDLEGRVAELDAALAEIPEFALELGRRQRTARVLAELAIVTEQRLRQEELRQALSFSNIQVIDPPRLEFRPIWPRKKLGLAVGLLIAGACALLTAVVVERADSTVRTEAEIRALTGAPLLGSAVGASVTTMSGDDVAALRRGADLAGANGRLTVASVGDGTDPAPVIEALIGGGAGAEVVAARVDGFSSAAALEGGAVVLLVRPGKTRRAQLSRAVRLARETGCSVVGTIVVGRSSKDVESVWA